MNASLRPALLSLTLSAALALGAGMPATAAAEPPATKADQKKIHPVRGFLPDLKFTLAGPAGQTVTEKDFSGKTVMMFFGYASCPDICPTTMAQLAQVKQKLGEQGQDVRILFISVDPHRDTPDRLQTYVNAFDKNAIGLSGTTKQIADVARRYRVAYQIEKPKGSEEQNYEVSHARGVYIFDAGGNARLLAADAHDIDRLADGVRSLVEEYKS